MQACPRGGSQTQQMPPFVGVLSTSTARDCRPTIVEESNTLTPGVDGITYLRCNLLSCYPAPRNCTALWLLPNCSCLLVPAELLTRHLTFCRSLAASPQPLLFL
jgi:hypothetical protein